MKNIPQSNYKWKNGQELLDVQVESAVKKQVWWEHECKLSLFFCLIILVGRKVGFKIEDES